MENKMICFYRTSNKKKAAVNIEEVWLEGKEKNFFYSKLHIKGKFYLR